MNNHIEVKFMSKSENESFARTVVAAFTAPLDPTLEEMADIKTAVSEAVTNSIVHGYTDTSGYVYMECRAEDKRLTVTVKDNGKGIEDVKKAMEPLFTTNTDGERSGMGFTVMETFMDNIKVDSIVGVGTKVTMTKEIGRTL